MTDIPRPGSIWLPRPPDPLSPIHNGRPITITGAGATATTGARVAYTDLPGRRRLDSALLDFLRAYEPARPSPHVLDAAIGLALAEEPGILPEATYRWRLCALARYAGAAAQGGARAADMAMTATVAAAWAADLDLAGRRPTVIDADYTGRREEILIFDCPIEYDRAAAKHHGITPYHQGMTDVHRAAILIEEVGEVARALTPDAAAPTGHAGDLRAELVQVATMALAWTARMLADADEAAA